MYYLPSEFGHEYRIKVDWYLDRSRTPITIEELRRRTGYGGAPRGAIKKITERRAEVAKMIGELSPSPQETRKAVDLSAPERIATTTYRILRDTELARRVKLMHEFQCQICGHTITLLDGTRYAEAHHIRPLGSPHNGADVIGNILCVCPNHHAELDYGASPIAPSALRASNAHSIDPQQIAYHNETICKAGSD